MWGRHVELAAEAATGNLNLFAVPFVIIANQDVFESLDAGQQAAVRDAGPSSVDDVLELTMTRQAEALQALCDADLEFVTATDEQLAAVRTALDPVYAASPKTPTSPRTSTRSNNSRPNSASHPMPSAAPNPPQHRRRLTRSRGSLRERLRPRSVRVISAKAAKTSSPATSCTGSPSPTGAFRSRW